MFLIAKTLKLLFSPFHLTLIFLVVGAVLRKLRYVKAARACLVIGFTGLVLGGLTPLGYNLTSWLESRVKQAELPQQVAGIIALGGAIEPGISAKHENIDIAVNASAERLFTFMALAKKYPNATLVYTGGSGSLTNQTAKESDYAKRLFEEIGFNGKGIIYERESRNTVENANNIKALMGTPHKKGKWLLVTSAYHMPRALAIFQDSSFDVLPYPVDYQTHGDYRWLPRPELLDNFNKLDLAFKEIMGLWVYKISRKF